MKASAWCLSSEETIINDLMYVFTLFTLREETRVCARHDFHKSATIFPSFPLVRIFHDCVFISFLKWLLRIVV